MFLIAVLDELLGENLAIAILHYAEVLNNEREIDVKRPFEAFLSKRCIKTFKQGATVGKAIRSLSMPRTLTK